MAEQIPYGVAQSLINRLASAAFREFGRIYGVMDELERLKSTVESIRVVLLDAEDKQEQSRAVQIWIRRLKDDVLYPADNLLDEFLIEDSRHKIVKSHKNKVRQDWEINRDELIQFWMAQGYLECSDEKQLIEDIAGSDCCYLDSESKRLVGSPMHVMLKSGDIGLLKSVDASRMRTLILLSDNNKMIMNEEEFPVILKFKYLRVLKLSSCSLSELQDSIAKLKHLRYFHLVWCYGLGSLLKSLSNIVCLHALILEEIEEVEFSAKDVSNLINLRHLNIFLIEIEEEDKMPSGFGKLSAGKRSKDLIFSKWISSLTNIVSITFFNISGLKYLPPMERLPFLKSLDIIELYNLEYICYEEPLLPDTFYPSLETLKIYECGRLRGWLRMKDDIIDEDDDENFSQSHHLSFPPSLSDLYISGSKLLTRMPTFPNLGKKLELLESNSEILEATLNTVGSKSLIEVPPLSLIKFMNLVGVYLDVKKFPKNCVQNLTSLEHLIFDELPSRTFQAFEISFKDNLNYLPSLREIKFFLCLELDALPDWICNLSSLEHIEIWFCKKIASLPEGMPRLTKLQTLKIVDCPDLIEECETQTSATWPKIAHIPNIILRKY
ncbi:hypothetical protein P8452_22953 [Trifolium repens]|nr:hypothetical protein P8452_22953 [Trifolium repens]